MKAVGKEVTAGVKRRRKRSGKRYIHLPSCMALYLICETGTFSQRRSRVISNKSGFSPKVPNLLVARSADSLNRSECRIVTA
jgi:hypothetical protein